MVVDRAGREHLVEETTHFEESSPPRAWPLRFLRLLAPSAGPAQWLPTSSSFALNNGRGPLKLNSDGTFSHLATGEIYKCK